MTKDRTRSRFQQTTRSSRSSSKTWSRTRRKSALSTPTILPKKSQESKRNTSWKSRYTDNYYLLSATLNITATQPRHWLHYTLVSGKKDPESSTIARFNAFSNHLAEWYVMYCWLQWHGYDLTYVRVLRRVVSLILCHDRPKNRARQIEKFVEIAQRLRGLNNYSALRAFVAGINNSTFLGDATMDIFMNKTPELSKTFRSWDILLQAVRSHRAYRMALKSSKGACIPALCVTILLIILVQY